MRKPAFTAVFARWFSDAADIPDSIRITVPMVASLYLFYSFNLTAAGISGLITGWLVGVQGRDLPYLKRFQILSLSTVFTGVATVLAYAVFANTLLSAITLCSIAVVYGLMSNQRPHIRLFSYNFGFTYIMAIHFASTGVPQWATLGANIFAGCGVIFTSLMLWPFFRGRILQKHIDGVHIALVDWLNSLHYDLDINTLATRRQDFYDKAHKLAYFSNSITSAKKEQKVKSDLQRKLDVSEYIISLERLMHSNIDNHTKSLLTEWIREAANQLSQGLMISAKFPQLKIENSHYIYDLTERIKYCYNHQDETIEALSDNIYLFKGDFRAFLHDFSLAIKPHSKEWKHGFKIAMTLAVTQFLTYFYKIPQGYWISLTAFIVMLTSSMGVTNNRMWYRFYGTALGGVYSFVCLYFFKDQYLMLLTAISVFFAFTTYHKERYDIHVFWLTSMIVFAVRLLMPEDIYLSAYRVIDTLFGVTIAFSVNYFITPNWTMKSIDKYVSAMFKSQIFYIAGLNKPQWEQKVSLYQTQNHYYAMKTEIMNLLKEPNLSPRTSKDWMSLLALLRRLNGSLLLASKVGVRSMKHHDLSQRWIHQVQWLEQTFPHRCSQGDLPPYHNEPQQPHNDLICELIEHDIKQLEQWMLYQRAYVIE
ncbi:TPA: FUSC family protein [Photobacterium damselae]